LTLWAHIRAVVRITQDHLTQIHRFTFELDRSYLGLSSNSVSASSPPFSSLALSPYPDPLQQAVASDELVVERGTDMPREQGD
jgi:hypothetical protein